MNVCNSLEIKIDYNKLIELTVKSVRQLMTDHVHKYSPETYLNLTDEGVTCWADSDICFGESFQGLARRFIEDMDEQWRYENYDAMKTIAGLRECARIIEDHMSQKEVAS